MKNKKCFYAAVFFFAAFVFWTFAVSSFDVAAIGPLDSQVGFSSLNGFFHDLTGVHLSLYHITDWLSTVPVCFCGGFGILGILQWIKRKSISKVDRSILVLGGFYAVVFAFYLFFEVFVINFRPILINGVLEASYPSSTTVLVMCIMPTAVMELRSRMKNPVLGRFVCTGIYIFAVLMVAARLFSGVHWLSDIIGGAFLSIALVLFYRFAVDFDGK